MCCGKKRTTLRMATPTARRISSPAVPASTPAPGTAVRFTETSSVKVKGPATGREYDFSPSSPAQNVDPRDARALLRSRFFRKA